MEPWPVLDGIQISRQMAETTPRVDELDDAGLLSHLVSTISKTVTCPLNWGVGNTQRLEDVLVESISPQQ